jgi:hypothetical protein
MLTVLFTIIFYLLVTYCVIIEISFMNDTKGINEHRRIIRESRSNKDEDFDFGKLPRETRSWVINQMFYTLVCFVGLFSVQWIAFLLILIVSIALGFFKIKPKFISIVDSLFCISVLLFIVINHYHLHINLTDYASLLFHI